MWSFPLCTIIIMIIVIIIIVIITVIITTVTSVVIVVAASVIKVGTSSVIKVSVLVVCVDSGFNHSGSGFSGQATCVFVGVLRGEFWFVEFSAREKQ